MTTPRIEEMVEEFFKDDLIRSSKFENRFKKALKEAHQAGIDEANSDHKSLEASWMALKDDYSEICRALGFEGDAWFGDPLVKHEDIVARAKTLQDNK